MWCTIDGEVRTRRNRGPPSRHRIAARVRLGDEMNRRALLVVLASGIAGALSSFGLSQASHFCPGGSTSIHLGGGPDNVSYGSGAQCVDAGAGNDVITFGQGNDYGYGRTGQDSFSGGEDDDILRGHEDGDTILGQASNDPLLAGHQGGDTIKGGTGNDAMADGTELDTVRGESGTGDQLTHCHDSSNDDIAGVETHPHPPAGSACFPNF